MIVVIVVGTGAIGDVNVLRQALLGSLPEETQHADVVHLTDESQWQAWIGRTPDDYGLRNIALAFAVAAYQRSTETPAGGYPPIGVAVLADSTTQTMLVAIQSCRRSEIHEVVSPQPAVGRSAAEVITAIVGDAVHRNIDPQKRDGRNESIPTSSSSVADAPLLLEDVWHGRRPAVWSESGEPWQADPNERPAGVLSGSFHPLHEGHTALRGAAEQFLGGRVQYELPIANADKPSLDFLSIAERLGQFSDSTLALTNAPTFLEKARILDDVMFIVGVDTAERIVDPRFYEGDSGSLDSALSEIASTGCRFLVAGRQTIRGFQTLRDVAVPVGFAGLFLELPESDFRSDISSTESRRQRSR